MIFNKALSVKQFQGLFILLLISFGISLTSFVVKQKTNYQKFVKSDTTLVRLGESNYYLKLPKEYKVTEARGKEGQLGYDIIPKEDGSKQSGFIEIEKGGPIGNTDINWGQKIEEFKSILLGREITWTLYKNETNHFVAETPKQDISARVFSTNRNDIINMISIISTLEKNK